MRRSRGLERALEEMALVVEVVSHTPNTVRSAAWWNEVRDIICRRNGVASLSTAGVRYQRRLISNIHLPHKVVITLEMAAHGYTVPSAAEALGVTQNTVKTHRTRAMRLLSAHTMTQAVATAMRLGLIEGASGEEGSGVVVLDWRGGADARRRRDDADGQRERVG